MSILDSKSLELNQKFLDLVAYRQSLVAGNIANLDTPGYRTRDIDFRAALRHAAAGGAMLNPQPAEVPGLMERPDGNNVSGDREALALAETQLQYRLGVEMIRHEFRMITTAINEGKS